MKNFHNHNNELRMCLISLLFGLLYIELKSEGDPRGLYCSQEAPS